MAFGRTIGNIDPWSMPSDGWMTSRYKKTRNWERRQYSKARRREDTKEIREQLDEKS